MAKNHLGRSSSSNSFVQLFLLLLPGERLSGRNKGSFENSRTFFHCVTFLPQPPPSCLSFLAASHQNNFPIILQNLITVQARKEWSNKKLDLDISPEKEGHHRSVAPPVEVGCNSNCERWHQRRQFRPNIPHGRSIPAATQIANNTSPKSWIRWCFGLSLQCWWTHSGCPKKLSVRLSTALEVWRRICYIVLKGEMIKLQTSLLVPETITMIRSANQVCN